MYHIRITNLEIIQKEVPESKTIANHNIFHTPSGTRIMRELVPDNIWHRATVSLSLVHQPNACVRGLSD